MSVPPESAAEPANLPLVDASGLRCPLPLLKLRQQLRRLSPGGRLRLRVTDPASLRDIPDWLRQSPHQLVQRQQCGEATEFVVQAGEMSGC